MSGQDTIKMLFGDTLEAQSDTLSVSIFNLSNLDQGIAPVDGSMDLVSRALTAHPSWLFLFLLTLLGFFAWIRMYYGNILTQTVQASTNFQVASRMFQDNSQLQSQLDNILYALYFLSIAFFLFFLEGELGLFPYDLRDGLLYLFNLGLLLGIFFGRLVLVNLVGLIFDRLKDFREYLYNSFIFNKLMGMAILPLLLFAIYTTGVLHEVVFWISISCVVLVLFLRLIRSLAFSFKKEVSIFYMFLYLCALEIVPLVLLYRWLEGIL